MNTRIALVPLALALSACAGQWYLQDEKLDLVTTKVRVDTVPQGAKVLVDGKSVSDHAPVIQPIEYNHQTQLYARSARFPPRREEIRRHVYGMNVHTIGARWDDGAEASQEVTLEGQDQVEVVLRRP